MYCYKTCVKLLGFLYFAANICANPRTFFGQKKRSFARFPPWNISETGSLKFKFKTLQANCVLLYIDDHLFPRGKGNFLKLMLFESRLAVQIQVSFPLGGNSWKNVNTQSRSERLGYHLNDNHYHEVEVIRKGVDTQVMVDSEMKQLRVEGEYLSFNSSVYIGGVPNLDRTFKDIDVSHETRYECGWHCILHIA